MDYIDYYQRTMARIVELEEIKKDTKCLTPHWFLDKHIQDNKDLLETLVEITRKH